MAALATAGAPAECNILSSSSSARPSSPAWLESWAGLMRQWGTGWAAAAVATTNQQANDAGGPFSGLAGALAIHARTLHVSDWCSMRAAQACSSTSPRLGAVDASEPSCTESELISVAGEETGKWEGKPGLALLLIWLLPAPRRHASSCDASALVLNSGVKGDLITTVTKALG